MALSLELELLRGVVKKAPLVGVLDVAVVVVAVVEVVVAVVVVSAWLLWCSTWLVEFLLRWLIEGLVVDEW